MSNTNSGSSGISNSKTHQKPSTSSNHHQHHHHSASSSNLNASQHNTERGASSTSSASASASTSQSQPSSSNYASHTDFHIFENIEYPYCTDMNFKYEKILKIGQGTFGEVYKAKERTTEKFVALKKVLTDNEKEGFPITALREIKILQLLNHENIVKLIEICTTKPNAQNRYKSQFFLVFEFCEHDLAGLLSNQQVRFTLSEMKKIMQQLLNGLFYIHKNSILHRDMKTANILVTKDGVLKLADFGLARALDNQQGKYTNRVVTLWYRPPELLLGERYYNSAIDMWGAGCIMAELWTRSPIMQGNTEQHQLDLIIQLCGSIEPSVWPDVDKLDLYSKMQLKSGQARRVKERMYQFVRDQYALDLLDKLLTLNPKKRIDSDESLNHDFFWTEPLPTPLKLDKYSRSMYEMMVPARGPRQQMPKKPTVNEQHIDRVY